MDLIGTLRKKIDVLDEGEHLPGLKAVLLHIETAFRHLSRGQDAPDDTAFTDAIYRTNQAFEGSVKEAYRVLAGKDPSKKSPFDIENYLEKNNIFRPRVLSQLTNYRTEWRNPSTHDYKLDFDESESFLAIVSVSAFASLLLDQVAERLAYLKSQAEVAAQQTDHNTLEEQAPNVRLLESTSALLAQFCSLHLPAVAPHTRQSESQLVGALHGFLASIAPELSVVIDSPLGSTIFRADMLISNGDEKIVIEVKRLLGKRNYSDAIMQVETYMVAGKIDKGILLILPESASEMKVTEFEIKNPDGKIVVIAPASQESNLDLQP